VSSQDIRYYRYKFTTTPVYDCLQQANGVFVLLSFVFSGEAIVYKGWWFEKLFREPNN